MSELGIVAMRLEDVDEVMRYEQQMFGTEAWSRSSYRDELAETVTRRYFSAFQGETFVGWAGLRVVGDEGEILTVGVVPDARRAGIGGALVDVLLADAFRRGARDVFLEVRVDNAAAHALYLRKGFTDMGIRRGYYDHGRVDARTMHRSLSAPQAVSR